MAPDGAVWPAETSITYTCVLDSVVHHGQCNHQNLGAGHGYDHMLETKVNIIKLIELSVQSSSFSYKSV